MTLPSNTVFNIAVADPDSYKASLITWMQSKPQYSGYNFQGANWNVLFDVLARNTGMRAFYNNMIFSEMFLDSAQLRDNVVSRAKELGYIPSSTTSSSTQLNLTVNTNNLTAFTIPAGTRFSGLNSNGTYNFITNETISQTSSSGNYSFSNVNIYEGSLTSDIFTVDNSIEDQTFTLTNQNVDTTSIQVQVIQNAGANTTIFQNAINIFNLNGNSTVYYLQATSNNQYQVLFGDGVLGYQPQNGSVVNIIYRLASGTDADGCSGFSVLDNLGSFNGGVISNLAINAVSSSLGGANGESVTSIKFNAPRAYQTQQRGVTPADYKTLIINEFPSIGDVNVYGGAITANAVLYGTVLISAVTVNGNPLTQALKNQILQYIDNQDIIHAATKMVDANTLYVDVTANVHINFNITTLSSNTLESLVSNTISQWSNTNIQKYNTPFRYSQLVDAIDNTDLSIISNETSIVIKRSLPITIQTNTIISFSFNNPISNVTSDVYVANGFNAYLTDVVNNFVVGNGTLYQVLLNNSNNAINFSPIGSVNYSNGYVSISNLNISNFSGVNSVFYIYANPLTKDLYGQPNDIIKIDTVSGVEINVLAI